MPRTITLVVPDGIEPGDSLCFNAGGEDIALPLPFGAKPGDALQIQVADSKGVEGGDEIGDSVTEGSRKSGEKVNSSSDNAQNIRTDDDGTCHVSLHPSTGKELTFEPSESTTGAAICSELWPTGLVMANVITNPAISEQLLASVSGKKSKETKLRALEVGSGLGTVGMALATAMGDNNNAEVVLTDYASAIQMLEANIGTNKDVIRSNVIVKAQGLEWGKHDLESLGKFDVICGADLLYGDEGSYQPLVDTLSVLLKQGKGGLVLLGVRWRKPEKEKKFFTLAQNAGIHFTLLSSWLKEGPLREDESFTGMPSLSWEQYGDLDNDDFLQHLTKTKVSTGGGKRSVSLAEMDENDLDDMADEEHAAFERTQIQLYVGWRMEGGQKRGTIDATCEGSEGAEKKPKLS